jgi:hypothetical protein
MTFKRQRWYSDEETWVKYRCRAGNKYQMGRRYRMLGLQWHTPIIPATQEAEIRRIMVRSQPRAHSS